jgi:hypothetical protein
MKAFCYIVNSELFTSWSPGVGWGHNRENHIYMNCVYIKKKFSRTSRPISINVGTNHPWVKGILNCWNKGPGPFQRRDNSKNRVGSFKKNFQNHSARIGHIYSESFWYNVNSSFFKSWSPLVGRGHSRENHMYICLYKKKISWTRRPISIKYGTNHPWVKGILICSNKEPGPLQRGDNHNANIGRDHWKNFP